MSARCSLLALQLGFGGAAGNGGHHGLDRRPRRNPSLRRHRHGLDGGTILGSTAVFARCWTGLQGVGKHERAKARSVVTVSPALTADDLIVAFTCDYGTRRTTPIVVSTRTLRPPSWKVSRWQASQHSW